MSTSNLTLAALSEAYRRALLAGKIVYATSEAVPPDKVIHAQETAWSYEYFVFHDEETAQRIAEATGLALLHLRDTPLKPSLLEGPIARDPDGAQRWS